MFLRRRGWESPCENEWGGRTKVKETREKKLRSFSTEK